MAVAAVIITNFYQGFNTFAWNWWVFGSVLVGPVLILCYVAVYAAISPGWIWTDFYGLNQFLWPSAYWWFGLIFCFVLAFIPRYLTRYDKDWYNQADDTILKAVHRRDPNHDFVNDPMIPSVKQRQAYRASDADEGLPMQTMAQQGRRMTDATGNLVPVSSRGFAFVGYPSACPARLKLTFRPSAGRRPISKTLDQQTRLFRRIWSGCPTSFAIRQARTAYRTCPKHAFARLDAQEAKAALRHSLNISGAP